MMNSCSCAEIARKIYLLWPVECDLGLYSGRSPLLLARGFARQLRCPGQEFVENNRRRHGISIESKIPYLSNILLPIAQELFRCRFSPLLIRHGNILVGLWPTSTHLSRSDTSCKSAAFPPSVVRIHWSDWLEVAIIC